MGLDSSTTQGDYLSLVRNRYNSSGLKEKTLIYTKIPASGDGTLSTNYNLTVYRYNARGLTSHVINVVSDRAQHVLRQSHNWSTACGSNAPKAVEKVIQQAWQTGKMWPLLKADGSRGNQLLDKGIVFKEAVVNGVNVVTQGKVRLDGSGIIDLVNAWAQTATKQSGGP